MQSCRKFNALFWVLLLVLLPVSFAACRSGGEKNESTVPLSTAFPISADTAVTVPTSYEIRSSLDINTYIILNNENTTINGGGASFENSVLTISKGGSYSLKGKLLNGRIVVDTKEPGESVMLYLNGVNISFSGGSPLYITKSVREAKLILFEDSKNEITDYSEAPDESEDQTQSGFPTAVCSRSDLTVAGTGSLTIKAKHGRGIFSSDNLCIENGNLSIESADDAVCGKNSLTVTGGSVNAVCGGSGLRTAASGLGKGLLAVSGGSIRVESKLDCIQSSSGVTVSGGSFDLTSDGGSTERAGKKDAHTNTEGSLPNFKTPIGDQTSRPIDAEGSNAVSAERVLTVSNGEFAVNSRADAFSCSGRLIITGGNFSVKSDRTAFYSSSSVTVSGGNIKTDYCLDGIEAKLANISGGNIYINAQDCSFGADMVVTQSGGTVVSVSEKPGAGGSGIYTVTGGIVFVSGELPAHGTTVSGNAELSSSTKAAANILLAVTDERGKSLFCLMLPRRCEGFWFSSPELVRGKSYNVYIGGINTGAQKNGVYQGSSYTPGTLSQTVTAK